ncbi:hypothetical protein HK405_011750 [Cladochytrium tenue]|nr:hypothetical protein HK405_011750 [Cladochytrium tenue]
MCPRPPSRVGIAATHQVIDTDAYRHWHLAMFRRYYQGSTFRARLPDGGPTKDFMHTDVASFFGGQSGDGDTELPSVAQQGWKAFVVHLNYRYDPEGMLDLYTDHTRKFRSRNPRPVETRIEWRAYLDGARATLARFISNNVDTLKNGADYEDFDGSGSDEDASDDGIVTDAYLTFWPLFLRFAFLCHGGSVSIPDFDSPFDYYWNSLSGPIHQHNVM